VLLRTTLFSCPNGRIKLGVFDDGHGVLIVYRRAYQLGLKGLVRKEPPLSGSSAPPASFRPRLLVQAHRRNSRDDRCSVQRTSESVDPWPPGMRCLPYSTIAEPTSPIEWAPAPLLARNHSFTARRGTQRINERLGLEPQYVRQLYEQAQKPARSNGHGPRRE
jgi:hypothetical protein